MLQLQNPVYSCLDLVDLVDFSVFCEIAAATTARLQTHRSIALNLLNSAWLDVLAQRKRTLRHLFAAFLAI